MEPHSSLVALAHFAVGKFIFLKPTSTHKLSLAWHQLPQRFVSNVLEKSAIIYILCREKQVTKKVVCLIQLHFLDLSLFIILSEVLQSSLKKKTFFKDYKSISKERHILARSALKVISHRLKAQTNE